MEPQQKELFFKKIGDVELGFYINRRLKRTTDLAFVGLFDRAMSEAERGLLKTAGLLGEQAVLRTHAWSSVYYALKAGGGFGVLPSFYDGKELSLMHDLPTARTPVWLVMDPDVRGSGRIKALTDFVTRQL